MNLRTLAIALFISFTGDCPGQQSESSYPKFYEYALDTSVPFKRLELSDRLKAWRESLIKNMKFREEYPKGKVRTFMLTDLVFLKNGTKVRDSVYQCIEDPTEFYVRDCSVFPMFSIKEIGMDGIGGNSWHSPPSRKIIVILSPVGASDLGVASSDGKSQVPWPPKFDGKKVRWSKASYDAFAGKEPK